MDPHCFGSLGAGSETSGNGIEKKLKNKHYLQVVKIILYAQIILECRVADPHHFYAEPDPAFHFNEDPFLVPDPAPRQKVMGICDPWTLDPPGLHFEPPPLRASTALHGSVLSL